MPRALRKMAYLVCVAAAAAVLAGCAETTYPDLPGVPSAGDSLLSPTEQQRAIRDLSEEQKNQGAHVKKENEGR